MNFEKNHREHKGDPKMSDLFHRSKYDRSPALHKYGKRNLYDTRHREECALFCTLKQSNSERTPRTLSSSEPREIAFNAERAQKKGYLQSTAKGSKWEWSERHSWSDLPLCLASFTLYRENMIFANALNLISLVKMWRKYLGIRIHRMQWKDM